ncbi:hypothetical protein WJX73_002311 [Symbiochloris irregularis]|uniref:NAD(P)-dependent oxidoreductase n=1 Tax=Symbiochloris irregularis TaxID=706552 RepID=A0AAW1PDH1_9CHLO
MANGNSDSDPSSLRVGFVGLGIMGLPMANNLVKAGYRVTVWNRSADKAKPLTDKGAQVVSTPQEVAERSDVTVAMLADPAAARAVANEVAPGMAAGKGYVDMSTIDAQSAQAIRDLIKGKGAQYLEAPVSGSKQPAEQGKLVILAAGDRELYDRASPLFEVMGKASFYLGEVGKGANMKIAVNMLMGSMLASYAEALALAEAAGLNAQDFVEVINTGAMAAPIFALKGPAMVDGKYPPAFPLRHQKKDMGLAEELGKATSQPLKVANAVHELYTQAAEKGLGDEDFTAVLEAVGRAKR